MSKAKLYKIDKEEKKKDNIQFIVGIVVYAIVLIIVASLFKSFYIKSFFYAIIAALILSGLNYMVKPILIYWTLPLNILTYGITYPIVNMIILKICDLLMGSLFNISGFWSLFLISIFISVLKLFFDNMITKNVRRG